MNEKLEEALSRIKEAKEAGTKVLYLGDLKLTEIPKEVFELTNLTRLDLWNNQ